MVEIAGKIVKALNVRMTGDWLDICTLNLIEKKLINQFQGMVMKESNKEAGIQPKVYVCQDENSAGEIPY